jgi:hypothetical protein
LLFQDSYLTVLKAILFFQFKIFVAHQLLGQSSQSHKHASDNQREDNC